VEPTVLAGSKDGPLLEVVKRSPLPVSAGLFSAIALTAVSNTALINMIMASRLLYGMAKEGVVPAIFGRTLASRQTPSLAIAFTTGLALALVATGDVRDLASTTVLLLLVAFVLVHAAVLVLRRRPPLSHRHFSVPSAVPVFGALTCLGLMTQLQRQVFVRAGLLLAVGVALFLVNSLALRRSRAGA
jgi:amino acid transporter